MIKIFYAVLALKRKEADELVARLRADNLENHAKWLENNKERLYGDTREDWKPFWGMTIKEMLDTKAKIYESATGLIDELDDDFSNIGDLYDSPIAVYFVDVFALYFDRYRRLANRIDSEVGKYGKCCLVVPYGLSQEIQQIQDQLVAAYNKLWPTVWKGYLRGSLHRIIMRPDDLTNFREYLVSVSEDGPNPLVMRELISRWGTPQKEVPRMGG